MAVVADLGLSNRAQHGRVNACRSARHLTDRPRSGYTSTEGSALAVSCSHHHRHAFQAELRRQVAGQTPDHCPRCYGLRKKGLPELKFPKKLLRPAPLLEVE